MCLLCSALDDHLFQGGQQISTMHQLCAIVGVRPHMHNGSRMKAVRSQCYFHRVSRHGRNHLC